jgi:hypothetical protein
MQHSHWIKCAAEVIRVFECSVIRCKALEACCMILNSSIFTSLSTESMHTLLTGWASMSRGDRKGLAKTEFQGSTIGNIHCQELQGLHYDTTRQRMQKYDVLSKVLLRVQKTPPKRRRLLLYFCAFEKYKTRSVKYIISGFP